MFLLVLLTFGCESGDKLTFGPLQLRGEACNECPEIEIDIPMALDETTLAKTINAALEEEIIALLFFDDTQEITTTEGAMASFTNSFRKLKTKLPNETIGWKAKINSDIVYEDEAIVTLVFDAHTFTGGAHGYGSTAFLNFDKRKGTELENWELFEDIEGFQKFAETKFRIQEDIPQDGNINATGFMFEQDIFYLAENMGYTENGLQLTYNQYEIASYADGPIVLSIPFAEANKYLKQKGGL